MFSLKSNSHYENETGQALTKKILNLLNDDKNAETIRQCYMEIINVKKLPLSHPELCCFINEEDIGVFNKKLKMNIDFKKNILKAREDVDLHNLCSAISYLSSNSDCKSAVKKAGKAGEWIKFEGIDKDIKKLVVEADGCELKNLLSVDLQRGYVKA